MKLILTLLLVIAASVLLVSASSITSIIPINLHQIEFINNMAKYQIFALTISLIVVLFTIWINPESKKLLSVGNLSEIAKKEKWLGINGKSSWKKTGLTLLIFISMLTATFMLLAVIYTDSINNFQWRFLPFILLFSLVNSLSEELIFRFGVAGGLFNSASKITILILSSVLFGLPHYYGWPSGAIGVIMAGVLGYVLCKATMETKGLGIAWAIHFFQDVIIFTALLMMSVKG